MNVSFIQKTSLLIAGLSFATASVAQDQLTLSSTGVNPAGVLSADLKCTRDGGDGLSPPLDWTGASDATQSYALIMHHYPRGSVAGQDVPSHYWLVWNIPADAQGLTRGNVESLGDQGSDKHQREIGYTAPCSPGDQTHDYTITLFALDSPVTEFGEGDNMAVGWQELTDALEGKIIDSATLEFAN